MNRKWIAELAQLYQHIAPSSGLTSTRAAQTLCIAGPHPYKRSAWFEPLPVSSFAASTVDVDVSLGFCPLGLHGFPPQRPHRCFRQK